MDFTGSILQQPPLPEIPIAAYCINKAVDIRALISYTKLKKSRCLSLKVGYAAVGIDGFEDAGHPAKDGIWWADFFTGLVDGIPPVAELVFRIASDAERIIHERLSELSL